MRFLGYANLGTQLRGLRRNIVVFLSGAIASVVIGHLVFEISSFSFENSNKALGLFLAFLLCIPSVGIGYFATRIPVLQSALVFVVASMVVTIMDYAPAAYPGRHFFPHSEILGFIREQLIYVAAACVLAYVGALFRGRMKRRLNRNRDATL